MLSMKPLRRTRANAWTRMFSSGVGPGRALADHDEGPLGRRQHVGDAFGGLAVPEVGASAARPIAGDDLVHRFEQLWVRFAHRPRQRDLVPERERGADVLAPPPVLYSRALQATARRSPV